MVFVAAVALTWVDPPAVDESDEYLGRYAVVGVLVSGHAIMLVSHLTLQTARGCDIDMSCLPYRLCVVRYGQSQRLCRRGDRISRRHVTILVRCSLLVGRPVAA